MIEAALRAGQEEWGREQGAKAVQRLVKVVQTARKTIDSAKLKSVLSTRHKLTHRLKTTREEKRPGTVSPMKYGYERSKGKVSATV
jgi:hypothetical protein